MPCCLQTLSDSLGNAGSARGSGHDRSGCRAGVTGNAGSWP